MDIVAVGDLDGVDVVDLTSVDVAAVGDLESVDVDAVVDLDSSVDVVAVVDLDSVDTIPGHQTTSVVWLGLEYISSGPVYDGLTPFHYWIHTSTRSSK